MEKWTRFIISRRKTVLAIWIIVVALGLISGAHLNSHLTTSFTIPGSPSAQADSMLSNRFNENIEGTFTVLYPFKNADTKQIQGFKSKIAIASKSIPTASIGEERAFGGTLFANINTSLSLIQAANFTQSFRTALKEQGLKGALVTGPPAIKSDVTPVLSQDLQRGELIALFIAFILLLLVFGFSQQLFIPFLFALGSISATMSIVYLIAQKFLVVLYIPNIVGLIGLGLSIDYSLLMLFRFRTETQATPNNLDAALVRTVARAGKTVALSALTVAIALGTLTLVPIPFIRSLGFASALVPILSLVAALSLQPALLSFFSPGKRNRKAPHEFFKQLGTLIVRRPLLIAVSSLLVLVGLALPVMSLHLTPSSLTALPAQLESQRALSLITRTAGSGVITPNELIIDLGANSAQSAPALTPARTALAADILQNSEVLLVATGSKPPYVEPTGRYLRLFVFARHGFGAPQAQNLVKTLRNISLPKFGFSTRSTLHVAGAAAQGVDLLHSLTGSLPWIVGLALFLTFLILLRAFKSLVLPLKAIALDLISLSVAYGIVVFIFGSEAISKALGLYHLNQIEAWALLFLFVLLFGISMDYEVFIISRIKEGKENGLSNSEAIIEGLSETGMVVTTAALIFMGAVSGLALGHFAGLQEIGIGLAFGTLIDATIIRALLLPSVMVLLGRWNWWLPARISRYIKTRPAPLDRVRG